MTHGRDRATDKSRSKSTSKLTTKPNKQEREHVVYDSNAGGWRGAIKGKNDTLQITKIQKSREKQLKKQDPDTVQHNRKKAEKCADPDLDEDDDTASISRDVHKEVPRIKKPFEPERSKKNTDTGTRHVNWSCPTSARSQDVFRFEKPANMSALQASVNSPVNQVTRLQTQLDQKDTEMDVLRNQLWRSQKENIKLVNQLNQCSGQKFSDVARENVVLRDQVERLTRQITKMWGDDRREKNRVLHRLLYEQELEADQIRGFTSER